MSDKYTLKAPNIQNRRDLTGNLPSHFDENILPSPKDGFILLITAPRGSGKSYLLFNLLKFHYKGCFDMIYIFNPSYQNDMTLSEETLDLPSDCFVDHIDVDMIENVMEKQLEEKKQFDKGQLRKKHLSRILFVFDDCINDPAFSSNKNGAIMSKISMRGRHYSISSIFTSQTYATGLPLRVRKNIPNHIIFGTDNKKEIKSIVEEISGTMDEEDFLDLFKEATKNDYDFFFVYGTCPDKTMKFRRNLDNILSL